jgi:hypothetical protein
LVHDRSTPGLRLGFAFFVLLYYNGRRKAIGGFKSDENA